MSSIEAVVEDLKALPPHRLAEAARYIHSLRAASGPNEFRGLEHAGGMLNSEDAAAMERALADCRQIDANEG